MVSLSSALETLKGFKYIALQPGQNPHTARLTLQRPEALNALNPEVIEELGKVLMTLRESDCRCLIVTGAGEKAFVAGADIKAMTTMSWDAARAFAKGGQNTLKMLEQLPCATIAAVNGFALGGGLELALCCDIILASENAKFGLPEVSLGLIPGFGGTQRLARCVGLNKAREMIFTGGFIGAADGQKAGLVNQVYPMADLLAQAEKMAGMIAGQGPIAIAKAKQSVLQGWDMNLEDGLLLEAQLFSELFNTSDQREGTLAFVEKRKANFTGK